MVKGRQRRSSNRKLPKYLYRDKDSFRYRNPETGMFTYLGTDEAAAIKTAHQANLYFSSRAGMGFDRIITPAMISAGERPFIDVLNEYEVYCMKKTKSDKTKYNKRYMLNKYKDVFAKYAVNKIDIYVLSEWMENNVKGFDSWVKHQCLLSDIFKWSHGKGYLPLSYGNPASALIKPVKAPKIRQRLTLEQYKAIYEIAPDWMKVAMSISLQTSLRLGDVVNLKFENVIDDYLYVIPNKTKDITNPINLKIKMGDELKKIIKLARSTNIHSPYIVHRRPEKIKREDRDAKDHWTQVYPNYVSHEFVKVRSATGLFTNYKSGEAPSFHEIRALSSYLYKAAGREQTSVQTLMGHTSPAMTKHYQSGHGIEYVETWANLNI